MRKVSRLLLVVAVFLWVHFFIRSWVSHINGTSLVCNDSGPLGISFPVGLLLIVGFGVGIFFFFEWKKATDCIDEIPWLLLLAGGLGNFLERIRFGCIMDYIALPPFPVFNVADILLTGGVIGALWFARKNCRL